MTYRKMLLPLAAMIAAAACTPSIQTDVLVIGGSTSGVAAAISAAREGVKVTVVEETPMLGGMLTSQGVSATDGNYELRGGLWKEFQDSLFARYGGPGALKTGWVSLIQFEPHVGDAVFKNIAAGEPGVTVIYGRHPVSAVMDGNTVLGAVFEDGGGHRIKVSAKVTIDATDLGDFLPLSATEYRLGMDARSDTGEEAAPGTASPAVQDMTLVAVLKDFGEGADMTIPEPEGFDRAEFDGLNVNSEGRELSVEDVLTYGRLPNGKYMLNWPGPRGNDIYLDAVDVPYRERQEILKAARAKTLRFIYYIQTVLGRRQLGIADDEFDTEDGLAFSPYHREGRRLKGVITFTINSIADRYSDTRYRTSVSVGNYPLDHHHAQRSDIGPIDFPKVPSFGIPAGVMIPGKTEGLIVSDKAISVSNLANGSTRLQPAVLSTGQAAGTLAALAVKSGVTPREVPVRTLQQALLDGGCYLQPLYDVPPEDEDFGAIQRICSTGILKMTGEPYKWANRTWFFPDSAVSKEEIAAGINEFYPTDNGREGALAELLPHLGEKISRREAAALIDSLLSPFSIDVDFEGKAIR